MHELTYNFFNDKTHLGANDESVPFGYSRKSSSRQKDVNKDMERILHTGSYSHSNPVISRVGLYLTPVVGGALSFLCLARSIFNILTWRDPFLSFWISLIGSVLALVLFIFPWRWMMLIVGFIAVGPQNWILRLIKERNGGFEKKKEIEPIDYAEEEPIDLPPNQPLFQGHAAQNQRLIPLNRGGVDERAIHYAIVPECQLMYQRFYDWPPEPEYSRVKTVTQHVRRRSIVKPKPVKLDKSTSERSDEFDNFLQQNSGRFKGVLERKRSSARTAEPSTRQLGGSLRQPAPPPAAPAQHRHSAPVGVPNTRQRRFQVNGYGGDSMLKLD